jgi:hypothetical protein
MIVLVTGLPGSGKTTVGRIRAAAPLIGPLGVGPHLVVDTSRQVEGKRLEEVAAWLSS